jgi:hypothetical protein
MMTPRSPSFLNPTQRNEIAKAERYASDNITRAFVTVINESMGTDCHARKLTKVRCNRCRIYATVPRVALYDGSTGCLCGRVH